MADEDMPLVDAERFIDIVRPCSRPTAMAGDGYDHTADPAWNGLRILVVGAGGLGCELLHCLALAGFEDIHVIDMDTIDLSNLNRQFLFRDPDVGKEKSNTAAAAINKRFPWVKVTPHFGKIQDKNDDFYRMFHIAIMGLDSIPARQWLNKKYADLATWTVEDGEAKLVEATPLIDGGTEGFRGSLRHISFGKSACIECTMWMYPPQQGVPMCTLQNVPRVPEHCVLYVKEATWKEEAPFGREKNGDACKVDGDNVDHIVWIMKHAQERQEKFKLKGNINFQFTQGVVKNVIPAVGFTNAMIAAMCVNEALKLATGMGQIMNNYTFYSGSANGIASYTQVMEPDEECPVCQKPQVLTVGKVMTPRQVLDKAIAEEKLSGVTAGATTAIVAQLGGGKRVNLMLPPTNPLADTVAHLQGVAMLETLKAEGLEEDSAMIEFAGGALEGRVVKCLIAFN